MEKILIEGVVHDILDGIWRIYPKQVESWIKKYNHGNQTKPSEVPCPRCGDPESVLYTQDCDLCDNKRVMK